MKTFSRTVAILLSVSFPFAGFWVMEIALVDKSLSAGNVDNVDKQKTEE